MWLNAIQLIKYHAIKIKVLHVILQGHRHGAILITQMINYAQHKMELIALVLHLVGT